VGQYDREGRRIYLGLVGTGLSNELEGDPFDDRGEGVPGWMVAWKTSVCSVLCKYRDPSEQQENRGTTDATGASVQTRPVR